jgi:tRNA modification GTPase
VKPENLLFRLLFILRDFRQNGLAGERKGALSDGHGSCVAKVLVSTRRTMDTEKAITYAGCLTPAGTAAIATLAIRGPSAWEISCTLFQPRSNKPLPLEPLPGGIWLGRFGENARDEAVLIVKQARPVPAVELHCHGGREVVRLLLELLAARGCRVCDWHVLERITTPDLLQHLAAAALAEARTSRTAAILLDQHQGAFARAVEAALAALEDRDKAHSALLLGELARWTGLGRHLVMPWRVTVAGAPNVGKSSLVNALAGFQRCVVSAMPGTTRDVVTTILALDGWPVEVADTSGVRSASDDLERKGIELARSAAGAADLCLWVLDGSAAPAWPTTPLPNLCLVINKVDLAAAWSLELAGNAPQVSAQTGEGIPELCGIIARCLVPEVPSPGSAVPFTAELCRRVEESQEHLAAGRLAEARAALQAARG